MARIIHKIRWLLLYHLHLFAIIGPIRHNIGLLLIYSNVTKDHPNSKDYNTLLQLLPTILI